MSWRTIIEINHDHLRDAGGELADLVEDLGHRCLSELKEQYRYSSAVKVLAQRHHSYDMRVVIASSPDTPLQKSPEVERAKVIEECREAVIETGRGAAEASKAKDATDYIAGYQDCAIDADEALRSLLEPQSSEDK